MLVQVGSMQSSHRAGPGIGAFKAWPLEASSRVSARALKRAVKEVNNQARMKFKSEMMGLDALDVTILCGYPVTIAPGTTRYSTSSPGIENVYDPGPGL